MYQEVEGDLLLSKCQAIAHGVAPGDHFDSGLALALRERWPAMVKDFRHYCQAKHPKPGTLWSWNGPGVQIISLLTQEPAPDQQSKPGRASLANVNHCLRELRKVLEESKIMSIAMPRLATGVGGLDWKEVRPLLLKYLEGLKTSVVLYTTFHSGMQASENISK